LYKLGVNFEGVPLRCTRGMSTVLYKLGVNFLLSGNFVKVYEGVLDISERIDSAGGQRPPGSEMVGSRRVGWM